MRQSSLTEILHFDDGSLMALLNGRQAQVATPVDALRHWRHRETPASGLIPAVASLLANHPERLNPDDLPRLSCLIEAERSAVTLQGEDDVRRWWTLARLYRAVQRLQEAEDAYRRALRPQQGYTPLEREERWQARLELAGLFDLRQQGDQASRQYRLIQAERALAGLTRADWTEIRGLALELALAGDLEAAAELYQGLLARQFEAQGTLVHLARVRLLQQRVPEARRLIAAACRRQRRLGPDRVNPYVPVRILFLRIFLAMLKGRHPGKMIDTLRQATRDHSSRMDWTIEPVLDLYRDRLSGDEWKQLRGLAMAISGGRQHPSV